MPCPNHIPISAYVKPGGIRPEWASQGIARFRYVAKHSRWSLYWRDRNQRWHKYDLVGSTPDVLPLLDEVDRDPTGIFWG